MEQKWDRFSVGATHLFITLPNDQEFPFTSDERYIIGSIARYHRKAHPKNSHFHFAAMSKDNKQKVRVLAATTSSGIFVVGTGVLKGDLNSYGILTPADATIALRLAATGGWDPAADMNHDSRITSLDALMILRAAGGAITL